MYKGYFIIILCFCSCFNPKATKKLTDDEFYKSIPEDNYRDTLKKIDSLLKYGKHSDHRRGILYHEKGRMLGLLEQDNEAITSLKKSLHLLDKKGEKMIAGSHKMLGTSYSLVFEKDSAAYHIKKAYNGFKKIGHKTGEAHTLNTLGHLAFLDNDFSSSVNYIKKAIDIQLEIDDKNYLSSSYNNLGYILEQTKGYDEAIKYYRKSADISKQIGKLSSSALRNLAYVYLIKNDIKKSKAVFKEALIIEEKTAQHIHQKEIYEGLIEASIKDKDYVSLPVLISKKDSVTKLLDSFESKEKIKLLNIEQKEFLTQEKLKQELKLNKKNRIILGSLLGFLLVFSLYIFQRNRNTNLVLKQQALELEQKMLIVQMSPHFIFNTLAAIQNKVFDSEPLEQISFISKFAKLMRQNFEFANQKEISLTEDINALTNYIETQQLRFNHKFNYTINIDEIIDARKVLIPPMLLQIFVENAIEHGLKPSKNKGELIINIKKNKTSTKFEIIDNGVGYTDLKNNEDHAIDIFKKRLQLRKLGEEKLFSIQSLGTNLGTKVIFSLKLESK